MVSGWCMTVQVSLLGHEVREAREALARSEAALAKSHDEEARLNLELAAAKEAAAAAAAVAQEAGPAPTSQQHASATSADGAAATADGAPHTSPRFAQAPSSEVTDVTDMAEAEGSVGLEAEGVGSACDDVAATRASSTSLPQPTDAHTPPHSGSEVLAPSSQFGSATDDSEPAATSSMLQTARHEIEGLQQVVRQLTSSNAALSDER